jgi:hypothetical protein
MALRSIKYFFRFSRHISCLPVIASDTHSFTTFFYFRVCDVIHKQRHVVTSETRKWLNHKTSILYTLGQGVTSTQYLGPAGCFFLSYCPALGWGVWLCRISKKELENFIVLNAKLAQARTPGLWVRRIRKRAKKSWKFKCNFGRRVRVTAGTRKRIFLSFVYCLQCHLIGQNSTFDYAILNSGSLKVSTKYFGLGSHLIKNPAPPSQIKIGIDVYWRNWDHRNLQYAPWKRKKLGFFLISEQVLHVEYTQYFKGLIITFPNTYIVLYCRE